MMECWSKRVKAKIFVIMRNDNECNFGQFSIDIQNRDGSDDTSGSLYLNDRDIVVED